MERVADFVKEITNGREVEAMKISFYEWSGHEKSYECPDKVKEVALKEPSEEEIEKALEGARYKSGYGMQTVHGTVLFKDGSWATVEEHGGDEYWMIHKRPSVEEILGI